MTSVGVVDRVKEIGELVALSAFYKDITTVQERGGGPYKGKKLALISEFDIEYRYDLRQARVEASSGFAEIVMPECTTRINTGNITIYDEQDGKWMGIPVNKCKPEDRNQLMVRARQNAAETARKKTKELLGQVERSAENTLCALLNALDVHNVKVTFSRSEATLDDMVEQFGQGNELDNTA